MTLHDYAKYLGIQYRAAWNHFNRGEIKGAYKTPSGIIVVPDDIFEVYKKAYEDEQQQKYKED